jgi:ribosomal protein S18 acetylase RimI-like enzyme
MEITHAEIADIERIIRLSRQYLRGNLTETQSRRGFLGKLYTRAELELIIADRNIVIATDPGYLAGYYLIGRKDDPDAAAYFRNKALPLRDSHGASLPKIAYPTQVCIDETYRNTGLFGKMLAALMSSVKGKYTHVLCSVSEDNSASIRAHLTHGWQLLNTFESRQFFIYKT